MTAITLEAAQAKLNEAQANVEQAKTILDQVKAQSKPTVLKLAGITIELRPGERYAGLVLDAEGKLMHHLVLLADKPEGSLSWNDAMAWAQKLGAALPTRQEQALLYANCKSHMEAVWHWSSQTHESDASSAWFCYFGNGDQLNYHKSAEGAARAVRRVNS